MNKDKKLIGAYLDLELAKEIKVFAHSRDMTISDLIRAAVVEYMKAHREEKEK